jgi:hypothetical protein
MNHSVSPLPWPTVILCGILSTLFLVLVSCGRADPQLAAREIGSLLYSPGDALPTGFRPGAVHNDLWPTLKDLPIPLPAKATYQTFFYNGKLAGVIQVLLYEKRKDMGMAGSVLNQADWEEHLATAMMAQHHQRYAYHYRSSSRCYAAFEIVFLQPNNQSDILKQYLDTIEQRLEPIVCQNYDVNEATAH